MTQFYYRNTFFDFSNCKNIIFSLYRQIKYQNVWFLFYFNLIYSKSAPFSDTTTCKNKDWKYNSASNLLTCWTYSFSDKIITFIHLKSNKLQSLWNTASSFCFYVLSGFFQLSKNPPKSGSTRNSPYLFISVFTRTTEVCMTESPLPGVTANKFNFYFFVNLIPDYALQKLSNYTFQRLNIP